MCWALSAARRPAALGSLVGGRLGGLARTLSGGSRAWAGHAGPCAEPSAPAAGGALVPDHMGHGEWVSERHRFSAADPGRTATQTGAAAHSHGTATSGHGTCRTLCPAPAGPSLSPSLGFPAGAHGCGCSAGCPHAVMVTHRTGSSQLPRPGLTLGPPEAPFLDEEASAAEAATPSPGHSGAGSTPTCHPRVWEGGASGSAAAFWTLWR